MEKPGIRRRRGVWSRLLALGFLAFGGNLSALTGSVDISSRDAEIGAPLSVTIVAYGAAASDTSLVLGEDPEGLLLTESRKSQARLSADGGKQENAVVFSLTYGTLKAGVWPIGPFEVRSGEESLRFGALPVTVRDPRAVSSLPLRWVLPGAPIRVGESRDLFLYGPPEALNGSLACVLPENALLELLSAQGGGNREEGSVEIARYRWTPLAVGEVSLPQASVSLPSGVLMTEPSAVFVGSPLRSAGSAPLAEALQEAFTPPREEPEPAAPPTVPAETVERLRLLRSAEYRSFFPSTLRSERLALEAALGMGETLKVPPAAWKLPLVLAAALVLMVSLLFLVLSSRRALFGLLSFLGAAAFFALAFFALSLYIRDTPVAGVADPGPLYNVPDTGSRAVETLFGGEAFRVLRVSADWIYAEDGEGKRGWIQAGRFRPYTDDPSAAE